MQLTTIAAAEYVRDVLPFTNAVWGEGRSLERYTQDFDVIAASAFGKRHFRTIGLRIDGSIVASCKRYERKIRCGDRVMRAAGIGAVFTPSDLRGRGYATAMIGALLDSERAVGNDVAYLFSDIHPAFYERLGFIALPSRSISLRADTLRCTRRDFAAVTKRDWPAIRRCFEALEQRRPLAFERTPLMWELLRTTSRFASSDGQRVGLIVRRARGVAAYVFGRRLPRLDTFVLDEFGYTDHDGFEAIAPLIRSAAGDLRRIGGWLPPDAARPAIPRGAVKKRKDGIMMIALLSQPARAAWRRHGTAILADNADRCWSTDHI